MSEQKRGMLKEAIIKYITQLESKISEEKKSKINE
jgi:hypothetical protein